MGVLRTSIPIFPKSPDEIKRENSGILLEYSRTSAAKPAQDEGSHAQNPSQASPPAPPQAIDENWPFTTADARIKRKRLHPSIEGRWSTRVVSDASPHLATFAKTFATVALRTNTWGFWLSFSTYPVIEAIKFGILANDLRRMRVSVIPRNHRATMLTEHQRTGDGLIRAGRFATESATDMRIWATFRLRLRFGQHPKSLFDKHKAFIHN